MNVFTVDGVAYPGVHVTGLKRSFSVLDGPNAGRVMTFDMVRDVGGTFYNYSLDLKPDGNNPEEYDRLYEVLSAPVDFHVIEMPYAQSVLTFKAYVSNGDDSLVAMREGLNIWDGLSVNFIAMSPQRRPA